MNQINIDTQTERNEPQRTSRTPLASPPLRPQQTPDNTSAHAPLHTARVVATERKHATEGLQFPCARLAGDYRQTLASRQTRPLKSHCPETRDTLPASHPLSIADSGTRALAVTHPRLCFHFKNPHVKDILQHPEYWVYHPVRLNAQTCIQVCLNSDLREVTIFLLPELS